MKKKLKEKKNGKPELKLTKVIIRPGQKPIRPIYPPSFWIQ